MFGGIHLKSCILRLNKQHQEGGWGIMSSRAPILEETVRKHIRKMPHPQDYLRQEFLATDGDEKKEGQLSPWQQDQAHHQQIEEVADKRNPTQWLEK